MVEFRPLPTTGAQRPKPNEGVMKGNFRPLPPSAITQMDRGEEDTPIANQNEQGIFDGSTYKPGGNSVPENQETYQALGEPLIGGWETGPRIQKTTNDQGDPRTYFVPTPEQSEQGLVGSTRRAVEGAGLEAVKGTLGFGEYLLDTIMSGQGTIDQNQMAGNLQDQFKANGLDLSGVGKPDDIAQTNVASDSLKALAGFADSLLNTQFSEADKNWIDENFPTMPAQNDAEKMAQEIGSVVIGAIGGAGGWAKVANRFQGVTRKIAEVAHNFFNKAKEVDLANAPQKTQLLINELAQELLGANTGAVITSPTDMESISGNFMPDTIGALDENETNKVGHFLDNTLISSLFNVVGRPIAYAGGKLAKNLLGSPAKSQVGKGLEEETAVQTLKQIDPGLAEVSPEEFKRRATAFSDMVKVNSEGDVGSFGTIQRGPVATTIKGAQNYVNEAYGYLKRTMTAEQWEEFSKRHAALITDNIVALRRDNMSNTIVQSSDARINDQASNLMKNRMEAFGGSDAAIASGTALGKETLGDIKSASDMVNIPRKDAEIAAGELEVAQNKDVILSKLAEAQKAGTLGDSPQSAEYFRQLGTDALYDNWERSYANYNNLFDQVPETPLTPDQAMRIAMVIAEAGDDQSLKELTNIAGAGNLINPVTSTDPAVDPIAQLAQKWEGQSLKSIFNDVRPYLSDTLNNLQGVVGVDRSGVIDLKKTIDAMTLNSDDPAFKTAMDAYKDHMSIFGQIDDLQAYHDAAQQVANNGQGRAQLNIKGNQILQDALSGNDTSGEKLVNVIGALQRGNPEFHTQEVADALVATAIDRIAAQGGNVSSNDMVKAIQDILPTLRTLSPDSVQVWTDTVNILRQAEANATSKGAALAQAEAQSRTLIANAEKRASSKFIEDFNGGQLMGGGDITAKMNEIFRNEGATRDLVQQAQLTEDPLIINGIKAQYLGYLKDRIFTNSYMAADGVGGAVQGSSGAQLNKFLNSSNLTDRAVLETVFSDTPQFAEDLLMLLDEVQLDNTARNIKPQTFSSNTAVDNTRRQALNTLITVTLGTLNRTAATARNLMNNITGVQANAQKEEMEKIIAGLLVDSSYLTDTLDKLGSRPSRDKVEDAARGLVDLAGMGTTSNAVIKGGVMSGASRVTPQEERSPNTQNKPDINAQTTRAFGLN